MILLSENNGFRRIENCHNRKSHSPRMGDLSRARSMALVLQFADFHSPSCLRTFATMKIPSLRRRRRAPFVCESLFLENCAITQRDDSQCKQGLFITNRTSIAHHWNHDGAAPSQRGGTKDTEGVSDSQGANKTN